MVEHNHCLAEATLDETLHKTKPKASSNCQELGLPVDPPARTFQAQEDNKDTQRCPKSLVP